MVYKTRCDLACVSSMIPIDCYFSYSHCCSHITLLGVPRPHQAHFCHHVFVVAVPTAQNTLSLDIHPASSLIALIFAFSVRSFLSTYLKLQTPQHLTLYIYIICFLIQSLLCPPPADYNVNSKGAEIIICSLIYSQYLKQCQTHSRSPINIF